MNECIDSIMDTYELPQRIKDNIKEVAHRRIEELFIDSYNGIYEYIASLVDTHQTPYKERFFTRLDSSIKGSSKTLYYDLIKDERFCPENKSSNEENSEKMSLDDILDILNSYIDPVLLNLIQQLRDKDNNAFRFDISSEYLITNAPKIQERLENLFEKYGENMSLIITRPIKKIQFSPLLKIKFGCRFYNGNPLAYFIEHRGSYPKNVSRTQLSEIDGGLCRSLQKANQLKFAIPEIIDTKLQPIPLEKRNAIIEAYKNCKIAREVAREICVAPQTVIKYWRENNLEIGKSRERLSQEKINTIIKIYKKYENANKTSRELNIPSPTVLRHCRAAHLLIHSRAGKK